MAQGEGCDHRGSALTHTTYKGLKREQPPTSRPVCCVANARNNTPEQDKPALSVMGARVYLEAHSNDHKDLRHLLEQGFELLVKFCFGLSTHKAVD